LQPTDLVLNAGELTLLVGPNGAGKTTLLHALARIGETSGRVTIDGRDVAAMGPNLRARYLGYLPAGRELHWPLAARDLVALGQIESVPGRVAEVLDAVGASHLAGRRVDRLSTGERARILLARALVTRPDILLLDEPIANLDPLWQLRVLGLLKVEAKRGMAILATVHDLGLARAHAARVIVMEDRRIVADGAPGEALSDAMLARVFGIAHGDTGWRIA
jgi:iron complex transport system ATP-binding protein